MLVTWEVGKHYTCLKVDGFARECSQISLSECFRASLKHIDTIIVLIMISSFVKAGTGVEGKRATREGIVIPKLEPCSL
jgi:hypothetical protein